MTCSGSRLAKIGVSSTPIIAALLLIGFLSSAGATSQDLGFADAPAGYEWYLFEAGDSACLRPQGWFVKTEVQGDTAALFISKEDIDKEGEFKTGFSLNVARRVKAKSGQSPSQYAAAVVDILAKQFSGAEYFELPEQNGIRGIGLRYRDKSRVPTVVVHNVLLTDDERDVMRLMVLESPEDGWAETWRIGESILNCRIRK